MRRQIENIILITLAILVLWSIVSIISATINFAGFESLYIKQITAIIIGAIMLIFFKFFPYKILLELSPIFYIISLAMLILVLIFGTEVHGAKRWFNLSIVFFQPVEFVKISAILFLAYIIEKHNSIFYSLSSIFLIAILLLKQPDASSTIIFIVIAAVMLIFSRLNTRWLSVIIFFAVLAGFSLFLEIYLNVNLKTLLSLKYIVYSGIVAIIIIIIWTQIKRLHRNLKVAHLIIIIFMFFFSFGAGIIGSRLLKGYQKRRIVSFIMPNIDPLGAGFNTRQSILAVGAGRIFGRGIFRGTQTQLGFLPVRHADFIFSSIAEETGFMGATMILLLLGIILWQIVRIIERTEDYGARLIACGIFTVIFTQIVLNVGVALGLMPVMGVQLPFVSYGGTGMVVFLAMIGMLLNINRRTEILA